MLSLGIPTKIVASTNEKRTLKLGAHWIDSTRIGTKSLGGRPVVSRHNDRLLTYWQSEAVPQTLLYTYFNEEVHTKSTLHIKDLSACLDTLDAHWTIACWSESSRLAGVQLKTSLESRGFLPEHLPWQIPQLVSRANPHSISGKLAVYIVGSYQQGTH